MGAAMGGRALTIRVRFHIIRNACIEYVGKSQSCMVSNLPIIWKQTVGVMLAILVARALAAMLQS